MMDDLIELENTVSADGMRVLHLISNLEISLEDLKSYDLPADANVEIKKEVGAFHVRASYPIQGPVSYTHLTLPTSDLV